MPPFLSLSFFFRAQSVRSDTAICKPEGMCAEAGQGRFSAAEKTVRYAAEKKQIINN